LVKQLPGTANGICFITIEDETGCANLVVFENLFNKYHKEILQARMLMVEGELQVEGEVIHVIVCKCYNLNRMLNQLTLSKVESFDTKTLFHQDENSQEEKVFSEGRIFR
jgi:error-prone DNA polymerase